MVNTNNQRFKNEIEYHGSTVTVRDVTDDSYSKWGDAAESLGASRVSFITGEDSATNVYGVNWVAQTFTTTSDSTPLRSDNSADFVLSNIQLKLYRTGSPGTITVSVRATSSGEPTGSDLAIGTLSADEITTSSTGEWKVFDMSAVTLSGGVSGTQYVIIIRATSGDASNIVHVLGDHSSASYTGGSRLTSVNSGSTWTTQTDTDILFNVYGDDTTVKAMVQVIDQADDMVKEGIFQTGDKFFWFNPDASNIARGNRIKHNSKWYEINEVIEHGVADETSVLEARTKKI